MNGITDKTWIVYRHTSPDGKMYVGVTCKPPNRRWQNGTGYQNNKRFSADINLYGWDNFQHEVLLSGLSEANANLAEKIFIDYRKLTNPNNGYNLRAGGFRGYECSSETKQKISKANKGRLSGEKNPNYGKKHTKEAKLKMSMANKGKKIPQDVREKMSITLGKQVVALDINSNEVVSIFNSTRDAERQTGIPHTNIGECCRGIRKTAGGYKWEYTDKEK